MIFDMSPSTVGRFVVATGLATGSWLLTDSVSQETPGVRAPETSVARPSTVAAIPDSGFTEKLNERMKHSPIPSRGRNPFAYGSRQSARAAAFEEPAGATPPPTPVVMEPPLPVFKLSGIAADQENGATVLTAIIIDNGTMVFAKAGDKLSNGHSVVAVDETSVTIIDAAGVTQTLRLP
jgi:hypothetical protein